MGIRRVSLTLMRRIRHIWQPREGFPQYTMVTLLLDGQVLW